MHAINSFWAHDQIYFFKGSLKLHNGELIGSNKVERERESNCCPKSQDLTMAYFERHRFKNSLGSRIYKAQRSIRYEGRGTWKRSLLLVLSNFKITHLIFFSYFLTSISVMLDFNFKLSFIFLIIFLLDKWNYYTTTYIG